MFVPSIVNKVTENSTKSKLGKLLNDIRFVGLKPALLTLIHTRYNDKLEERYAKTLKTSPALYPGFIKERISFERGMRFRFDYFILEIALIAPDIVSVTWGPGQEAPSYAVVQQKWDSFKFTIKRDGESSILETDDLQVIVSLDGGIIFSSPDGRIIREDLPPIRHGEVWTHHALLRPESRLYGLGERAAPLNLRGGMYLMWNVDPGGSYGPGKDPLYFCAPIYIEKNHESSHLVFYDNYNPGYFTLTETAAATFQGGLLRYYVIPGPVNKAHKRFFDLTGNPPLPPRWALGYHQSRWGYKSQKEIDTLADEFLNHDLPISAIHLDIDYMDGYRVFTVNGETFPDLAGLTARLIKRGIHLVSIIDPGVKKDENYDIYKIGVKNKYFILQPNGKPFIGVVWPGKAAYPDFTNPEVRSWWSEQYSVLMDKGISGFWHDMNEPTTFAAWGNNHLPLVLRHNFEGYSADHKQCHNIYAHKMAEAGFIGQQKHRPTKRPWLLTRSAWIGTHRYSWIWTGDIESTWSSLKMCIPMLLNLSLSGQLFSGPDIGGFSGSPNSELYTRWFELATFLPFFRTHSSLTSASREPWSFGEETTNIVRKFLQLRRQLIPLMYSLAWKANQAGEPIIRPLFWPDRKEEYLWTISDQFYLGNDLMIAPILNETAEGREVIFPPGKWYDFWTGEAIDIKDNKYIAKAAIDSIPAFCKELSIIPLEFHPEMLTIRVFTADSLHEKTLLLQLYTDAGDGVVSDESQFRIDSFYLTKSTEGITLEHDTTGQFPLPYQRFEIEVNGGEFTLAATENQLLDGKVWEVPVDFRSIRFII